MQNGGLLLRDLKPDFRDYAVAVLHPGTVLAEATRIVGTLIRDVITLNAERRNVRVVGPDETSSNRLTAIFDVPDRVSTAEILGTDDHTAPDGRVIEVLSEHLCQGWLEGWCTSKSFFAPSSWITSATSADTAGTCLRFGIGDGAPQQM